MDKEPDEVATEIMSEHNSFAVLPFVRMLANSCEETRGRETSHGIG